tara:strand:+ start:14511 stop:15311 length:801 start_codon:yes stop_codon:yes gene_type:complete
MTFNDTKQKHRRDDNMLLFKSIPLFAELPEDDIEWFLKRARFVEYFKNNFLFQHGDPANTVYIIAEGWIKIYHDNLEGEQAVQAILTRGDTFGEESVVTGRTYPSSAQVIGRNAKCFALPGDIMRDRFADQPNVALKIISALADQLNKTSYFWELSNKLTAAQRLAAFLLKLSMDRGGVQTILLPYNKLLVAARLNMQPETLSRAMRRLKTDLDMHFKGREVKIRDLEKLRDYCEIYCCQDTECTLKQKLLCTNAQCDVSRMLKMM